MLLCIAEAQRAANAQFLTTITPFTIRVDPAAPKGSALNCSALSIHVTLTFVGLGSREETQSPKAVPDTSGSDAGGCVFEVVQPAGSMRRNVAVSTISIVNIPGQLVANQAVPTTPLLLDTPISAAPVVLTAIAATAPALQILQGDNQNVVGSPTPSYSAYTGNFSPLAIRAVNQFGVPIPNLPVNFVCSGAPASCTVNGKQWSTLALTTAANGSAITAAAPTDEAFTVASGQQATYPMTVIASGGGMTAAFKETFTVPPAPTLFTPVDPTSVTVKGTLQFSNFYAVQTSQKFTAKLAKAGQGIQNQRISYSCAGGCSLNGTQSASLILTTDGNGQAQLVNGAYVHGPSGTVNTVTATALDIPGSPSVTFSITLSQ